MHCRHHQARRHRCVAHEEDRNPELLRNEHVLNTSGCDCCFGTHFAPLSFSLVRRHENRLSPDASTANLRMERSWLWRRSSVRSPSRCATLQARQQFWRSDKQVSIRYFTDSHLKGSSSGFHLVALAAVESAVDYPCEWPVRRSLSQHKRGLRMMGPARTEPNGRLVFRQSLPQEGRGYFADEEEVFRGADRIGSQAG